MIPPSADTVMVHTTSVSAFWVSLPHFMPVRFSGLENAEAFFRVAPPWQLVLAPPKGARVILVVSIDESAVASPRIAFVAQFFAKPAISPI